MNQLNAHLGQSDAPQEEEKPNMLDQINMTFAYVGVDRECRELLDGIPGSEILKGRRVVMVDDTARVIADFAHALTVATEGNAHFIHHDGQSAQQLMEQIIASNPEILLMDFVLDGDLRGNKLVRRILDQNPQITVIGFSGITDTFVSDLFKHAGAKASIFKDPSAPHDSILELAALFEPKEASQPQGAEDILA